MFFKKIIIATILSLAVVTVFRFSILEVQATTMSGEIGAQLGAAAGDKGAGLGAVKDPRTIVAEIIRMVLGFIGTIFFVLTLYAGYLWMTAAGNEEQVTKAKTLLFQATVGLIIILMAFAITSFAIRLALGKGTNWGSSVYIEPAPLQSDQSPY